MKRRIVIAALMFAACGSQKPVENPLPPGYVTVGTFTGEVDKEAGTFTVTTDEGAGPLSRTHAVIPESATTVTITNTGAVVGTDVWNNAPSPTGAGARRGSATPRAWRPGRAGIGRGAGGLRREGGPPARAAEMRRPGPRMTSGTAWSRRCGCR